MSCFDGPPYVPGVTSFQPVLSTRAAIFCVLLHRSTTRTRSTTATLSSVAAAGTTPPSPASQRRRSTATPRGTCARASRPRLSTPSPLAPASPRPRLSAPPLHALASRPRLSTPSPLALASRSTAHCLTHALLTSCVATHLPRCLLSCLVSCPSRDVPHAHRVRVPHMYTVLSLPLGMPQGAGTSSVVGPWGATCCGASECVGSASDDYCRAPQLKPHARRRPRPVC